MPTPPDPPTDDGDADPAHDAVDPLAAARRRYGAGTLDRADLDGVDGPDPLAVLRRWIDEAAARGALEATAMVLSTADADGPDARVVLCKGIDHGVVWFTNHRSAKARQLDARPGAALTFHWQVLERQVRLRGAASRLTADEDDAYFAGRPRESQLGAWASGTQSAVVADRATLEDDLRAVAARFDGRPVPRPDHWGGWRLVPDTVELWQGRAGRLHDRLRCRRVEAGGWDVARLRP